MTVNITHAVGFDKKGTRPRLLMVQTGNKQEKAVVIRNCTKLRIENNPDKIRKVFITPDLTPKETQKDNALQNYPKKHCIREQQIHYKKREDSAEGPYSRTPPKQVRHTNPITANVNKLAQTQCYMFSCYQANAQSIQNKFHQFQAQVESCKHKITGITETWCNSDIGDGEINLDYNMFRSDRSESIVVGVLMYIHEDLPAIPCQEVIYLEIEESMWVSVKLNDKDTMLA